MAFRYANLVTLLIVSATLFAVGEANRNLPDKSQKPREIIVGGDQKWHFGFNYTDWAIKEGPFCINDTVVFKYDPPSNGTFPHNVFLLPDNQSFVNCDLQKAKQVADVTQGGGEGFKYVIKKQKPLYFACGVGNGLHCKEGLMKFSVIPVQAAATINYANWAMEKGPFYVNDTTVVIELICVWRDYNPGIIIGDK